MNRSELIKIIIKEKIINKDICNLSKDISYLPMAEEILNQIRKSIYTEEILKSKNILELKSAQENLIFEIKSIKNSILRLKTQKFVNELVEEKIKQIFIDVEIQSESKEINSRKNIKKIGVPYFPIIPIILVLLFGSLAYEISQTSKTNQNSSNKSRLITKSNYLKCKGCDEWTYFQNGNEKVEQKDFLLAIKYYELAIEEFSNKKCLNFSSGELCEKKITFLPAQMNLAYAQNKVGDFSGALKTYKKIYKHEQNGYYLSIIQRLQSKLGYYREAIQTNLKIIEINNNNRKTKDKVVEAFSNIGDLELKLYNYKDACNYWRKSRKVAKSILNNQLVKEISKENINKIRENCGDSKIVKVRKFFLW